MEVYAALQAVTSRRMAHDMLRVWYPTKYATFREYVEKHYPDLYVACRAYARINGDDLR